ncbi:hypothetical protein [Marinifilum sp. D737]|uniref:hypothetical protein n=1 Tax=Marinifilum sp. D737 TaxID=2969628 RepID=UPI00227270D8|nr:hypothetical protein [Marinifilum sp. D737]MCY1633353.1 hypothetical protein [Marinifilum sp. D737]
MSTLKNLNSTHLSAEQIETINTNLGSLETTLVAILSNLSSDERRKYGSISEQNKLLVNKVNDYAINQPALKSPDVDWDEFTKDFNSRTVLEGIIARLENLLTGVRNAKTLHDYDNYQASLDDYAYTNYKVGTSASGFESKRNELKQFFSRTKKVGEEQTGEQE